MIGHLKPSTCQLPSPARQQHQRFYCGICHSLRQQYSLPFSLLINNELTLILSALAHHQTPETWRTRCPATALIAHQTAYRSKATAKAAELSVVLAWIKATDWVADENSFWKRQLHQFLAQKTPQILQNLQPESLQVLENYLLLTQINSTDFEQVRRESGRLAGMLLREIAQETTAQTEEITILAEIFECLGEWVALTDHLIDLAQDLRNNQYNPIIEKARNSQKPLAEEYAIWQQAFNRHKIRLLDQIKQAENQNFSNPLFWATLRQTLQTVQQKVQAGKKEAFSCETRSSHNRLKISFIKNDFWSECAGCCCACTCEACVNGSCCNNSDCCCNCAESCCDNGCCCDNCCDNCCGGNSKIPQSPDSSDGLYQNQDTIPPDDPLKNMPMKTDSIPDMPDQPNLPENPDTQLPDKGSEASPKTPPQWDF